MFCSHKHQKYPQAFKAVVRKAAWFVLTSRGQPGARWLDFHSTIHTLEGEGAAFTAGLPLKLQNGLNAGYPPSSHLLPEFLALPLLTHFHPCLLAPIFWALGSSQFLEQSKASLSLQMLFPLPRMLFPPSPGYFSFSIILSLGKTSRLPEQESPFISSPHNKHPFWVWLSVWPSIWLLLVTIVV